MTYPWYKFYGDTPAHLDYFKGSLYDALLSAAERYPTYTATMFFGKKSSYADLIKRVRSVSASLAAMGVKKGDKVTICLPNCPQAVAMFYAINAIGAIANMVHPLSVANEIEFYLNDSESVLAVTLDAFYHKFTAIKDKCPALRKVVIADLRDELPFLTKIGYTLTKGRKIPKYENSDDCILWNDFLRAGEGVVAEIATQGKDDPAAVLYSGGTTGVTKGILLSNYNFNALGAQIVATNPQFAAGDRMLAIMPLFHGFGLGVCLHAMMINGGCSILVPQFNAKTYIDLLAKYQPYFIAGVPTLFEALLRLEKNKKPDLACLKGMFSGGDSLSIELKKKVDDYLKRHNASIRVREGYGTTECVTASCLTPMTEKEGSIGVPFPDTVYQICRVGTTEELPYGQEGEICISGPTVMLGYVHQEQETENTLKLHADGNIYVHTGDLGVMDKDGFVYFKQRIKRVIITNGYNVYPSQIENIIDSNEYVSFSCVIGVKNQYGMQRVKAYIVLKNGVRPNEEIKRSIMDFCRDNIARYAVPKEIEFRNDLPKTLVGKVAYRVLEEEANQNK